MFVFFVHAKKVLWSSWEAKGPIESYNVFFPETLCNKESS
jgi:hypothetical protein